MMKFEIACMIIFWTVLILLSGLTNDAQLVNLGQ